MILGEKGFQNSMDSPHERKKNTLPRKGGRGWELRGGEASGSPWFFLFSQGPWMMFLSPRDLRKEREEWEEAGKTWTGNH